jgi:hypothetical protein
VRAVAVAHYSRTPNPPVAAIVQKRLFELHMQNPTQWSADRLARVFAMPRHLCSAILDFQKLERDAFPQGTAGTVFDGSVEELLEEKFGVKLPSAAGKTLIRQERFVAPKFEFIDESEGSLEECVFLLLLFLYFSYHSIN